MISERESGRNGQRLSFVIALVASILVTAYAGSAFYFAADASGGWPDDAIYRFQGKCLALGMPSLPAPAEVEAFVVPGVTVYNGRVFGKYYPSYPILLAMGELARVPWLVTPVLAGLLVLGTFFLGQTMFTAQVGMFGSVLVATSPLVRNLATVYLSHMACAGACVWGTWAFLRARSRSSMSLAVLCGVLWVFAGLARPLTAAALAIPIALVVLRDLTKKGSEDKRWIAALVVVGVVGMGLVLAWNALLTGDPKVSAYEVSRPKDAFGFVDVNPGGAGSLGVYTPTQALGTLRTQLNSAGKTVFPVNLEGFALLLLLLPVLNALLPNPQRPQRLLLALAALVLVVAHFFYPGTRGVSAAAYGPRYYSEGLAAYMILVVLLGGNFLEHVLARRIPAMVQGRRWGTYAVLLLLFGAAAASAPGHWQLLESAHVQLLPGQNRRLEKFLQTLPPARRIFFVDISTYNERSALLANDPELKADNLLAIYRQPDQNRAVLNAYPGREAFLLRWPPGSGVPDMTPYVPELDHKGPPRGFPYATAKGLRFPPLEDRERDSASGKRDGIE